MKKRLCVLLAMLMLLSVLSDCGGQNSGNSDTGTAEVTEDGKIVLPVSGTEIDASIFENPQNMTFAMVRSGGTDEVIEIFDRLAEIPHLSTAYKYFDAAELDTQMNLALTAGKESSPYEMFRISLRNYRDFSAKGLLLPVEDYMEKYESSYDFADIPQSVWEPLKEMGPVSGIPLTVNVQHLFYRTDLFDQYHLEPPATVDEWIAVCEALKDIPEIEYPMAMCADKGNGAATEFVNMMYGADADFFDENEYPIFNQAEGVACLEKLITLASYCPPGVTSATNDDTMVLMQTGKIALMNTWASRASYMDDPTVSAVVGRVDYSAAPLHAEGKYPYANLSTDYMVIPANIKGNHEAAFLALAEMTSEEAQTYYMKNSFISRTSPVNKNPELLEDMPNAKAVSDTVAAGAQVGRYHPGFGPCWSIISTYVAMALDGEMTAQEALDQAAAESVIVLKDAGILK